MTWNVVITVSGDVQFEEEMTDEMLKELFQKAKEIKEKNDDIYEI